MPMKAMPPRATYASDVRVATPPTTTSKTIAAAEAVQKEDPLSAYEILKAIAHKCAAGESITIAPDWGLGSGTLIFQDGSHTHFGADIEDDPKKAVDDFIQGLHALLVNGTGLSIHVPETHTENPKN